MIRKLKKLAVTAGSILLPCIALAAGEAFSVGPAGYEFQVDQSGNAIVAGTLSVGGTLSAAVNVTSGSITSTLTEVTAVDSDYGNMKKTVLTVVDAPILLTAAGSGAATNTWGSVKIYDFPEGRILVHGVTVDGFDLNTDTNKIPIGSGGDIALGSVAASTNALSGTMVDFCPSTSIDAITNVVNAALAASAQFDGTTTPVDLYINAGVDASDYVGAALISTNAVSGVITIHWSNLGDY